MNGVSVLYTKYWNVNGSFSQPPGVNQSPSYWGMGHGGAVGAWGIKGVQYGPGQLCKSPVSKSKHRRQAVGIVHCRACLTHEWSCFRSTVTSNTHTHRCTHANAQTQTDVHTHCIHTHVYSSTYIHIHTGAHMQTYKHTFTHTACTHTAF